jgi:hypothetical protein
MCRIELGRYPEPGGNAPRLDVTIEAFRKLWPNHIAAALAWYDLNEKDWLSLIHRVCEIADEENLIEDVRASLQKHSLVEAIRAAMTMTRSSNGLPTRSATRVSRTVSPGPILKSMAPSGLRTYASASRNLGYALS